MTAVLWITIKKKAGLRAYLPGIAVFGSFLFSIIWEAKTRYIFPAFVMIIVCAAIAIPPVLSFIREKITVLTDKSAKRNRSVER